DRERVANAIQKALTYESGGNYDIEYTIVNRHTYEERAVRAKGKAIFDENKTAKRFSGILQDITEKKQKEDQIHNTATRLELALEAGKLGSYEYMIESGMIHCTLQCKLNFGLSEDDIMTFGKLVSIIIPSDRDGMEKALERAIVSQGTYNTEYRITWPDGSMRWIRACGKAVYDHPGTPVKVIGITVDITEEKAFSAALEKEVQERTLQLENKNKELERSNASLEEFTHIASHDLKEPMRKVHFFTDKLRSQLGERMSEEESMTFSRIENANTRMVGLIDDLLLYSRFSQRPPQMDDVDMNEKIVKVLEDLEVEIQQKKAVITITPLPILKGYQGQLQQLFQNLIGNALKYHQEGSPPVITISSRVVNGEDIGYPCFPEAIT
nr:PAS domain-containing protein [Chitinophagaceae bacterium]